MLSKIYKILICLFLLFIFGFLGLEKTSAQISPLTIDNLDISVKINQKGDLFINQNFKTHSSGYFSWIINASKISDLKIESGGRSIPSSEYQIEKRQDQIILSNLTTKSGEDLKISWQQKGDFAPFKDFDQFFWEPINESGIFISNLKISVLLPRPVESSKIKQEVYAIHGVTNSYFSILDGETLGWFGSGLSPYSSFTLVAFLPKGLVRLPFLANLIGLSQRAGFSFWFSFSLFLPALAFIILLTIIYFRKRAEDVRPTEAKITLPPDKVPPAVIGFLFREKVTAREIAATILDLASRGYLFIIKKDSEHTFGERKDFSHLANFERTLGEELFRGGLRGGISQFKEQTKNELFSQTVSKIYHNIYSEIAKLGWFVKNPQTLQSKYRIFGILLFFFSAINFFLLPFILPDPPYPILGFFGLALASLIFIKLADNLPVRTKKGQNALTSWLAFKKFLIEYKKEVGFVEVTSETFVNFLPYAVVLGCEKEWANHFIGAPFKIPDWYVSTASVDNLADFAHSLYPIVDYITKIMVSLKEPVYG